MLTSLTREVAIEGYLTSLGKLMAIQCVPVEVNSYELFGLGDTGFLFIFATGQPVVSAAWSDEAISPDTPIRFIAAFDSPETLETQLIEVLSADEISWRGFGSVNKYLSAPIKP